jgi:hypothetical protein
MVPSIVLAFSTDGERLMCGGFSLGETVHLGSFEFITDNFGGLSLSPRRSDSSTAFMGSTRSGPQSQRRAMIEDSAKEFRTASSGGGVPASPLPGDSARGLQLLPSPRHQGTRTLRPFNL